MINRALQCTGKKHILVVTQWLLPYIQTYIVSISSSVQSQEYKKPWKKPLRDLKKVWSFAEHEGSFPAAKLLSFNFAADFQEICNI